MTAKFSICQMSNADNEGYHKLLEFICLQKKEVRGKMLTL